MAIVIGSMGDPVRVDGGMSGTAGADEGVQAAMMMHSGGDGRAAACRR